MAEELNVSMSQNFIHDFIDEDIAQGGQYAGMTVHTRFPPEPTGWGLTGAAGFFMPPTTLTGCTSTRWS